jgi:hypothetical protein
VKRTSSWFTRGEVASTATTGGGVAVLGANEPTGSV